MKKHYVSVQDGDQSFVEQANSSEPDQASTEALEIDRAKAEQQMKVLASKIEQLYCDRLGTAPRRVTCNVIFDDALTVPTETTYEKTAIRLVIWVEGSITAVEKLLFGSGDHKALSICTTLNDLMRQHIIETIENCLGVEVTTLILDTAYDSECTGIIAQLSGYPSQLFAAATSDQQ